MAKIPVQGLIDIFQTMYKEKWPYIWGKSEKGCVDCSGAFVYAYRKYDKTIYHGSNRIARVYVDKLLPISEAKPGMAAFKVRHPGDLYYELRAEYQKGGKYYNGTLDDYYHIGLVDSDPNYVLNAKGEKSGFCRDPIGGKRPWAYVAYLKAVDYGTEQGDEKSMEQEVIIRGGHAGSPINLRASASTSAKIIETIPQNSSATLLGTDGSWSKIKYEGKTGYVMTKFVGSSDIPTSNNPATPDGYILVKKVDLEKAYDIIGDLLGLRG